MSVRLMSLVWELDLPISEKMVLLIVADHADDNGQNAWPSVATIARKASLSSRQVQRLLRDLQHRGWLWIEKGAGGTREMRDDRRPNRYTVVIHRENDGVTSTSPRTDLRGDMEGSRGDTGDANGVTPMSPKPSIEPPLIEPPIYVANRFDEFWDTYPRRTAKGKAEDAWRKAVEKESPDVIIAAADRFARDPNRAPQFTPHPATWLNQRRWEDEALPAVEVKISGTRAYLEASEGLSSLVWELEGSRDT